MGLFDFGKKKKTTPPEEAKSDAAQLNKSLEKTKSGFFNKLGKSLLGKDRVDESFLDDLEDILIASDVGVNTTVKIIERLETRVAREKYFKTDELHRILKAEILDLFSEKNQQTFSGLDIPEHEKPYVIMVVGVNGVGKTTTIGKLAYAHKQKGHSVILGAADTFRAAAVDQLAIWSERVDVPIISRGMNTDPASVAYDTVQSAISKKADVAILDTAGRLHNKKNLMNELSKIRRAATKVHPNAPHEVLLVLDASTGQNAIEQARQFIEATEVNAIALTKLDGTAKGGVVIGIVDQFKIPVKYIGTGEKMEDMRLFDKAAFVDSFFS